MLQMKNIAYSLLAIESLISTPPSPSKIKNKFYYFKVNNCWFIDLQQKPRFDSYLSPCFFTIIPIFREEFKETVFIEYLKK